jgi:hypothetical protein
MPRVLVIPAGDCSPGRSQELDGLRNRQRGSGSGWGARLRKPQASFPAVTRWPPHAQERP